MSGEYPPASSDDRRETILAQMLDAAAIRRRRRRARRAALVAAPLLLLAGSAALLLTRPPQAAMPDPRDRIADSGSNESLHGGATAAQAVSWQHATDPRQAAATIVERPLTDDELLELLRANDVEMGLVRIDGDARLVPWSTPEETPDEDSDPKSGETGSEATADSVS